MIGGGASRRGFLATAALSVMLEPAIRSAGARPETGASWRFFHSGSQRPLAVFADPQLASELGSQVRYEPEGLPPFFLDPSLLYRAILLDTDGAVLADIDPVNQPGQGLLFSAPVGSDPVTRPLQEHAREVVTLGDHGDAGATRAAIAHNEQVYRGLAIAGRAPGTVRSLQTLMSEGVSLTKDFAVVEGQLSTAGIADAVETAASEGFTLHIPGGQYRFDEPVVGRINTDTLGKPTGMRKPAIVGAGTNVSELLYLGGPEEHALTLEAADFPNAANLLLQGFRVHRPDRGPAPIASANGAGLHLKDLIHYTVRDLQAFRHGIGLLVTGCLIGRVSDFAFTYNRVNLRLQRGAHALTNVLSIRGGSLAAGIERGLQALGGSQLHVSDFALESTGAESLRPDDARGIELVEMGANGGVGAHLDHGYFEANRGVEVEIVPGPFPANYGVTWCNFNRAGLQVAERPLAAIRFAGDRARLGPGGPENLLDLSDSAFDGYDLGSGYRTDPSRPYLDLRIPEGYRGLTLVDRTARYAHAAEIGSVPAAVRRDSARS